MKNNFKHPVPQVHKAIPAGLIGLEHHKQRSTFAVADIATEDSISGGSISSRSHHSH